MAHPVSWFGFHAEACLRALRLRGQLRRGTPLIPATLVGTGSKRLDAARAWTAFLASRRAVRRLCPLDTCLSRSIVLFGLLSRYEGVTLHVGFRKKDGTPAPSGGPAGPAEKVLDGHAWVSVGGAPLGEPPGSLEGFVEITPPRDARWAFAPERA